MSSLIDRIKKNSTIKESDTQNLFNKLPFKTTNRDKNYNCILYIPKIGPQLRRILKKSTQHFAMLLNSDIYHASTNTHAQVQAKLHMLAKQLVIFKHDGTNMQMQSK